MRGTLRVQLDAFPALVCQSWFHRRAFTDDGLHVGCWMKPCACFEGCWECGAMPGEQGCPWCAFRHLDFTAEEAARQAWFAAQAVAV